MCRRRKIERLLVLESVVFGVVIVGVILLWASLPEGDDDPNGKVSNGD